MTKLSKEVRARKGMRSSNREVKWEVILYKFTLVEKRELLQEKREGIEKLIKPILELTTVWQRICLRYTRIWHEKLVTARSFILIYGEKSVKVGKSNNSEWIKVMISSEKPILNWLVGLLNCLFLYNISIIKKSWMFTVCFNLNPYYFACTVWTVCSWVLLLQCNVQETTRRVL